MNQARLAAVSIDLDELPSYFAIHGLSASSFEAPSPRVTPGGPSPIALHAPLCAVYGAALPRIASFAAARGIPLTLFAVGRDLDRAEGAAALRALHEAGHAVENHSYGHRYDLTRLPARAVAEEIARGADAIARATGRRPVGFRAPGYAVSDAVLDALEEQGFAYDASVFPCPAYYAAKAAAMGAQRAMGRRSRAVLDTPRVLGAPRRPYRPGRPWWKRGGRGLVELPIQTTPWLRLPVIGGSVTLAGAGGARWLARRCAGEALVSLELHGMDFLDRSDSAAAEALAAHQPELRVPLAARRAALEAFLDALAGQGRAFVRLDEAAEALGFTRRPCRTE